MSRNKLSLAAALVLSLVLGACSDATGPQECTVTQGAHDCSK